MIQSLIYKQKIKTKDGHEKDKMENFSIIVINFSISLSVRQEKVKQNINLGGNIFKK